MKCFRASPSLPHLITSSLLEASAGDSGRRAVRENPHLIARPERLVSFLRDRDHASVVELHRDLDAAPAGDALLGGLTGDAADDRAEDRRDGRAAPAAYRAARNAAGDRA